MSKEELSKLTDEELLAEAKKLKSSAILHALLIGIMIGIVIYSVAKNTWGFFTLIPLFFAYKLAGASKNKKELQALLKERNLDS